MKRMVPKSLMRALRWVFYSMHIRYETVSLGRGVSGSFSVVPCVYGENAAEANRGYTIVRDVQKGDVVIDAGGYRGMFSVYASKKAGSTGHVYSFEPVAWNRRVLARNLRRNACNNVTIIPFALGSKDGSTRFSSFGGSSHEDKKGDSQISVIKLDTFCRKYKVNPDKIRFVKMDVEGAELEVVAGAKKIIDSGKAVWAIASYHIVDGKPTSKPLEKFFSKFGYSVKTHSVGQVTTHAWKP